MRKNPSGQFLELCNFVWQVPLHGCQAGLQFDLHVNREAGQEEPTQAGYTNCKSGRDQQRKMYLWIIKIDRRKSDGVHTSFKEGRRKEAFADGMSAATHCSS